LQPLITEVGDSSFKENSPELDRLVIAPIIKIQDDYIVNPSTIGSALIHFIVLTSLIYGEEGKLSKRYSNRLWFEVINSLLSLGFEDLDNNLLQNGKSQIIDEKLFKFDNDKIAYIQLISDVFFSILNSKNPRIRLLGTTDNAQSS